MPAEAATVRFARGTEMSRSGVIVRSEFHTRLHAPDRPGIQITQNPNHLGSSLVLRQLSLGVMCHLGSSLVLRQLMLKSLEHLEHLGVKSGLASIDAGLHSPSGESVCFHCTIASTGAGWTPLRCSGSFSTLGGQVWPCVN